MEPVKTHLLPIEVADQFEAILIWRDEETLNPSRSYFLKSCVQTLSATVVQLKYQINENTMEHAMAKTLELDAIAIANATTYCDIKGLNVNVVFSQRKNLTVIDCPYEASETSETYINTTTLSIDNAAELIFKQLQEEQ